MTLTSAPVSTRKRKRLALSMMKNRQLGGRPEVSPAALGPAIPDQEQGDVHFWSLYPKRRWYQQSPWGGVGEEAQGAGAGAASVVGGELQRDELSQLADHCSQFCDFRGGGGRATGVAGEVTDVTVGIATSMILSAMSARVSNGTLSPDEARSICSWLGSC